MPSGWSEALGRASRFSGSQQHPQYDPFSSPNPKSLEICSLQIKKNLNSLLSAIPHSPENSECSVVLSSHMDPVVVRIFPCGQWDSNTMRNVFYVCKFWLKRNEGKSWDAQGQRKCDLRIHIRCRVELHLSPAD